MDIGPELLLLSCKFIFTSFFFFFVVKCLTKRNNSRYRVFILKFQFHITLKTNLHCKHTWSRPEGIWLKHCEENKIDEENSVSKTGLHKIFYIDPWGEENFGWGIKALGSTGGELLVAFINPNRAIRIKCFG